MRETIFQKNTLFFHTRCQLHQHFTCTFCAHILVPKIAKLCFGFEIFWRQNIGARKMLMKFPPCMTRLARYKKVMEMGFFVSYFVN